MFLIPSLGKLKCNLYKCYHYFPNSDFKNFDSHIFRSLAVFLTPFQAFQIPLSRFSLNRNTKVRIYFELHNYFSRYFQFILLIFNE